MNKAFTLIEIIIVLSIITILVVFATPYLFGAKEKALLESQRDKFVSVLEDARQKSISAHQGYAYSVSIDPSASKYSLHPDDKEYSLSEGVSFSKPEESTMITFEKLSGRVESGLVIIVATNHFASEVKIDSGGAISTGPVLRK